ncbi:amidophosphoribosyltransferase [Muribaculum intestinale]|jgi:amidophosphoribosyltransferase|uniref:Amidophosphoribosyltransferase n=2 Tax=Muribaculum intestinale TaxID=1796646 RepID=A0A1B1S8G8_9BACT|nr:amidophosphoribosyltransferase [Muribaculum intestinale]ANU63096.1 amidophosphoribosyltransferase [Muribaculum intestinale]ASB38827.1 amidophosphoribosyltransferase [Muribaculum intestinale]PWB03208.1 amidophosphoribosyltransferase [Muribaculum intestinale]PWB11087.1 amidophosphoribosyltransferase [Muribaculum intestinale]QQR09565.1 amidophosphoribosyltransferase [Muribaculum intestinale]
MGGFFGVAKRTECINELFYGVDYNSHMGTKRAGIATCNNGVFTRSIHNIENSYFRSKFEGDLKDFTGNVGVGVISDTDAQPIIVNCHLGKFAIVTVGRINNIAELEKELLAKGHHFCEHSYDIINPTEMVAALICEGKDYVSGIENVYKRLKGSCSMLLLTEDSIIAARDRLGRTPIIVGKKEGSHALTSETCAFPNLGYEVCYNLGPAEIVEVKADGFHQLKAPGEEMQVCAFLWTYYGYPVCEYEGRNVDEMRYEAGMEMGRNDDQEVDFVSAVPDSGIGMALGYAEGKGVPYRRGIVKYTPTWPRSFTPSTQERRELVARMKLIPNGALLYNKRAIFCDDSIVRGTQLRDNVKDLFDCGAKEVHVRISCPPLIYPCKFINFTASKSDMELITRRVIKDLEGDADKDLDKYATTGSPQYEAMVEKIREQLGLTSLKFSSVETVVKAIGLPKCKVCTHCFDGTSYE